MENFVICHHSNIYWTKTGWICFKVKSMSKLKTLNVSAIFSTGIFGDIFKAMKFIYKYICIYRYIDI